MKLLNGRALSGYLRNLEQAYRDRLREDHPMFPSGRLRYDVPPSRWPAAGEAVTGHAPPVRRARWDAPDQPIGTRTLTDLFHALERSAGVTVQSVEASCGVVQRSELA